MANYKKLTDVEVMEEVSENTMALVDENGTLKKVPCGAGFGGGNGIATAIIKYGGYDNAMDYVINGGGASPSLVNVDYGYGCINMTFQQVLDILRSGQPINAHAMIAQEGPMNISMDVGYAGTITFGVECVMFVNEDYNLYLYWTEEGISTESPGGQPN